MGGCAYFSQEVEKLDVLQIFFCNSSFVPNVQCPHLAGRLQRQKIPDTGRVNEGDRGSM